MFTQHGLNAIIKFILVVIIANLIQALTLWLFGFRSATFVYGFFLLTYMVNYEREILEKKNKVKVHKVTDL